MAVLELVDHPELNRKRQPKAAPAEGAAEGTEGKEATAKDPFGRFRKMFSPKSKVKGGAHGGKAAMAKGGAGRKTPAGGGSSKTGGSSS